MLLLKVAGSLTPSRYGGASKEGESMSAWERAVGVGPLILLEGNQEDIMRRDFDGNGGGGVRVTWGRLMWRE